MGGPPGRWWDDRGFAKSVGLRKDQQKKMDQVFNANRTAILDSYNTLKKEQTQLDALSKQPKLDEARIFASIDAVAQARAALAKANAHMLLQVRQELDPDQVERVEKLRGTPSEE
jgi:Spy/CpxP family protein refolding chaperone